MKILNGKVSSSYSSGAYKDVEIYDEFVVKKPKTDESQECIENAMSIERLDCDECENCPFKKICEACESTLMDNNINNVEDITDYMIDRDIVENFDYNNVIKLFKACNNIDFQYENRYDDDYIDEHTSFCNCVSEIETWLDFKNRKGLCTILEYDLSTGVYAMEKADIFGDDYELDSTFHKMIYYLSDCLLDKKSKNSKTQGHYNKSVLTTEEHSALLRGYSEFKRIFKQKPNKLRSYNEYICYAATAELYKIKYKNFLKTSYEAELQKHSLTYDLHTHNVGIVKNNLVITDYGCNY